MSLFLSLPQLIVSSGDDGESPDRRGVGAGEVQAGALLGISVPSFIFVVPDGSSMFAPDLISRSNIVFLLSLRDATRGVSHSLLSGVGWCMGSFPVACVVGVGFE